MLSLDAVSYYYAEDHRFELKPLSLGIGSGEVLAIAGKSGSGKTTLLKILAGLFSPTNGAVYFGDERLPDPTSKLIRGYPGFTIVHQDFELFPRYTVGQNIVYPLRRLAPSKKKERLQELLSLCDIEDIEDARVIDISGGQKQRTAIATALAGDPKVLIMDEPFSHLDQVNKSKLSRSLKKYIFEKKVSAVLSSHDPTDILGIADRVALLNDGALVAIDTPRLMYDEPQNEDIARLFGDVNIVEMKYFAYYGLDTDKGNKALIRPGYLRISSEGKFKGKVIEKVFSGWYNQIVVRDKNYLFSIYSHESSDFDINDQVKFDFVMDKVSYVY